MADITSQQVISDLGSEEVKLLIDNYNALLAAVGTFATATAAAADVAALKAAGAALETAIEANTVTLVRQPNIPARPTRPTY
jgi:hypothetical protein